MTRLEAHAVHTLLTHLAGDGDPDAVDTAHAALDHLAEGCVRTLCLHHDNHRDLAVADAAEAVHDLLGQITDALWWDDALPIRDVTDVPGAAEAGIT